MGLSGVKNKTKLAHDPNNTNWSKSTTNFGHKILTAQGWKPGEFLGAENAAQASHYTAANASHIRVALREENMGIGMQVGKGNAETFGLSMFSGLLGRLNGNSDEELEKKQAALRDVELGTFHARRYGSMNFVSGGLLVGDKMELKSTVLPSKKRKAEDEAAVQEPEVKKTKKSVGEEGRPSADVEAERKRSEKKERKERKEKEAKAKAKEERRLQKAARKAEKSSKSSTDDGGDKAKLKAEKRARKEERRARKEEKRARRAAKDKTSSKPATQASESSSESDGTATPPETSTVFGGRHAVRQRYIMQKRRAHMDPQALKEIFMLQAKAAAS